MKKKVLPVLVLATLGLGSYATTYMVVKQSDGTAVEFDVENVVEVTYRRDSLESDKIPGVSSSAPCVTMCDNEMAVKTLNVVGSSLFAPLVAKFWDGKEHSIVASTEDGSIVLYDPNHAKIYVPDGVADNGTIVFENSNGASETDFIFRDTRNLLITHDDPDYLNLFNQERPYEEYYDEEGDSTVKMPSELLKIKESILKSENTRGDFSVFWDVDGYSAWTYSPKGDANPEGVAPKYPTPFGCFSESIVSGETSFNDYVIKFEVFVPAEYPINGNGLSIGFYGRSLWYSIREYCAFWQPSVADFSKDEDGVWQASATFDNWTTGGDWMTITIPMEEIRYNFMAKTYYCAAQYDRRIVDGSDLEYVAFGDSENGLPFFDFPQNAKLATQLLSSKTMAVQSIGIEFGSADQPNTSNQPFIAVDNLRIVPKNNNGGVYPMLKWGIPSRDFYRAPVYNCK